MSVFEKCRGVRVNIISYSSSSRHCLYNLDYFGVYNMFLQTLLGIKEWVGLMQVTVYPMHKLFMNSYHLSFQFHGNAWNVMKQCLRYAVRINLNSLDTSSISQWVSGFRILFASHFTTTNTVTLVSV